MTRAIEVHGLRDGLHTAVTAQLQRQLKERGARVTLAATGRVRAVDASGAARVYALVLDATVDPVKADSPLRRALADLDETGHWRGISTGGAS